MTSFTQEELARLVQFITGSSQLPPGGFAELSPPIQISSAPTTNALPTAHTWWVKYRIFRVSPPPPTPRLSRVFLCERRLQGKDVLSKEFFLSCWRKRKILWNAFMKIVLIMLVCPQSLKEGSSTRQIAWLHAVPILWCHLLRSPLS